MTRRPDILGTAGRAWYVPLERARRWARQHQRQLSDATLAMAYVNGQGFHPFWSWWMVGLVHLREEPGLPPPKRHYVGAEYEISIFSCNPEKPAPDVNGQGFLAVLTPPDLVFQFHGLTPEQALGVHKFLVEAICAGRTSPDADWRRQNREALARLVNDYYMGRYGGAQRPRKLEVHESGIFTGLEEPLGSASGLEPRSESGET